MKSGPRINGDVQPVFFFYFFILWEHPHQTEYKLPFFELVNIQYAKEMSGTSL